MKKETITHGSGWLMQWSGRGVAASLNSGDKKLFLSLSDQPDVMIPQRYWRWLAGALVEAADKVETEEL